MNAAIIMSFLPTAEINDYAKKIGIDVDKEAHLLHIALEGLMKALPEEWKPW